MKSLAATLQLVALAPGAHARAPSPLPADCDRPCLERLLDEERAVMRSDAVFDLGGTVRTIAPTSGETLDMGAFFGRATSIEVTGAFKIEHGKIHRIEMIGGGMPYHTNSPRSGLSGR